MKLVLYAILPVLLALASIGLVYQGIDNLAAKTEEVSDGKCMDLALRLVPSTSGMKKMNDSDYITTRQVLYGLAMAKKLDVMVAQEGNTGSFRIASTAKTQEETMKFLNNYDGIQDFLTSLQSLPYSMSFESFCLGKGCAGGFVMVIQVKR